MSASSTIGFDTSAINALEDGGVNSEPLMKVLEHGFDVRLFGMTAEECLATPAKKAARREALLTRCERLLASGRCLWPPHEVIRLLMSAHFRDPARFKWQEVDVRASVYEQAIIRRDFTEELAAEHLQAQLETQKEFEKMWARLRQHLNAVRMMDPSHWPLSFQAALPFLRGDGSANGLLWAFGQMLYERATGSRLSYSEIKAFIDACPPIRACAYGLGLTWFDRCVRPPDAQPSFKAGRNDMMMVAYLPYCERFVTADWDQEQCLREVASVAEIECEVLSYRQFDSSFATTV
jgi:hypothetical protein